MIMSSSALLHIRLDRFDMDMDFDADSDPTLLKNKKIKRIFDI